MSWTDSCDIAKRHCLKHHKINKNPSKQPFLWFSKSETMLCMAGDCAVPVTLDTDPNEDRILQFNDDEWHYFIALRYDHVATLFIDHNKGSPDRVVYRCVT